MSYLIEEEIPCSHCQFPNQVEVWTIVNVQQDPELKDLLLGGELNMAECTACRKIFYAEHFLLYHDTASELLAFVYPYKFREERPKFEQKTAEDFARSQDDIPLPKKVAYLPLTLFGLDELVRMIEEEDEMGIQAEIVSVLAPGLDLKTKKIRPSLARRQRLPTVLPYAGENGKVDREALLGGLMKINQENGALTVYAALKEKVEKEPKAEFQFE